MADVSAAATAMGIPEGLVERSVAARAAASGTSVDDLLAAWAGGESAAPATQATPEQPAAEAGPPNGGDEGATATEPLPREEATPPEIIIDVPVRPAASLDESRQGPYEPPVLVGAKDNPMIVLAGALGLFLIILMVGLVGPSIPFEEAGARTSHIDFSEGALDGQAIYLSLGCASCHTQMVRPVVADVGLGPVTLDDTDQILGTRRFGPDLADVGSRITAAQIEAIVEGLDDHPGQSLDPDDMTDLVAYLVESATPLQEGES